MRVNDSGDETGRAAPQFLFSDTKRSRTGLFATCRIEQGGAFSIYLLEYILTRTVIFVANLIPLSISYWIGKRLGDLSYYLMGKRRKVALSNISKAYGDSLTPDQKRKIARRSFENVALSIVELFTIPKFLKSASKRFRFKGIENMEAAFAKGKGVIWVISHLGSWEYLAFLPYLKHYSCSVVVKALKNPYVNQELIRFRKMTLNNPIAKKNAAKEILYELKKNHLVSILIDQWAGGEGAWTTFFGQATSTTSIPVRIAKKTGCALIPAYCIRKSPGQYEFDVKPAVPLRGDGETWEAETTQELNRLLEEEIRKYPEQWMWGHRRWKPKPHFLSQ